MAQRGIPLMASIETAIGTDHAYGIATLRRGRRVVARVHCSMFPTSWFEALQEKAQVGDLVEVRLGRPLHRTEQYRMATANHNGFVIGFCTEAQWRR